MTDPTPAPAAAPPTAAVIVGDLPCCSCGYNLRSLAAAALCPECGRPVADSLKPDLLIHDEPAFLGRLVRGTRLLLISAGVSILILLLWVTVIWGFFVRSPSSVYSWYGLLNWAHLLIPTLELIAVWRITSRKARVVPSAFARPASGKWRNWTRAMAIWSLLVQIPMVSGAYTCFGQALGMPVSYTAHLLTFLTLRQHARRIPSPALARHCLLLPLVGFFQLVLYVPFYMISQSAQPNMRLWELLAFVAQAFAFSIQVWKCVLLALLYKAFRETAAGNLALRTDSGDARSA
jgi:hypothetical protein